MLIVTHQRKELNEWGGERLIVYMKYFLKLPADYRWILDYIAVLDCTLLRCRRIELNNHSWHCLRPLVHKNYSRHLKTSWLSFCWTCLFYSFILFIYLLTHLLNLAVLKISTSENHTISSGAPCCTPECIMVSGPSLRRQCREASSHTTQPTKWIAHKHYLEAVRW